VTPVADPTTIAAIATPPGAGGVGMVRLSGARAVAIGRRVFRCHPPLGARSRRVEYGCVCDREGRELDTALGWVLRGPRSYTGEDMVEITTHGSDVVLERVLDAARAAGADLAGPGEFTRRAFLSGRLDLVQAEAVVDVIRAGGQLSLGQAYGHLSGALSREVEGLRARLAAVLAQLEVGLDFAEEDVAPQGREELLAELDAFVSRAAALVETFEGARRRQEGRLVVLVGRPNVGKSTLLNALLGEERAIVTAVPGTTRDLVEGRCVWAGESVRLVDTAGLDGHERGGAVDVVEREGMARARAVVARADVVVALVDGSAPWSPGDAAVAAAVAGWRTVWVVSKADLPRRLCLEEAPGGALAGAAAIAVSAQEGMGLQTLREAVTQQWSQAARGGGEEVVLTRQRHREALLRACEGAEAGRQALAGEEPPECAAAALHGSLGALGELLGRDVGDDVLDAIFSEFCIGK